MSYPSNGKDPLVSIITLVYNTGVYVVKALESVKMQAYPNVQHLIIDDCSSDRSVELVEAWAKSNLDEFTFIKHSKNLGVTKSMNEGLRLAKGKYISFVSDDLFLPGKLTRQVKMFEELPEDYGVVYSDIEMLNDEGQKLGTLFGSLNRFNIGPEGNVFEELFVGHFIHGSAALIKNDCFKKIGYFNESLIVEDIDMYLRIARDYKFKFDSEISAMYRLHDKSLLQTIGILGLDQNLRSLEPYAKYSVRTRTHFVKYLDWCLESFCREESHARNEWLKKRWGYKKDLMSIVFYFFAVFNIRFRRLGVVKKLLRPTHILRAVLNLKNKLFSSRTRFRQASYSQCGEDILVQYVFNLRDISKPTYLDIGANHPFFLSNTAIFYQKGCRGINIEANPVLYNEFKKRRPNDINLNVGVGDKEDELDFHIMSDNTLSTFSRDEKDLLIKNGKKLERTQKVKLTTVGQIIDRYCNGVFPDFLSLDVEGFDFQILRSIDFTKTSPKVICVEAAEYSPTGSGARRNELIDFLTEKGYYEYANTNLNAIMVRRDFWFV